MTIRERERYRRCDYIGNITDVIQGLLASSPGCCLERQKISKVKIIVSCISFEGDPIALGVTLQQEVEKYRQILPHTLLTGSEQGSSKIFGL